MRVMCLGLPFFHDMMSRVKIQSSLPKNITSSKLNLIYYIKWRSGFMPFRRAFIRSQYKQTHPEFHLGFPIPFFLPIFLTHDIDIWRILNFSITVSSFLAMTKIWDERNTFWLKRWWGGDWEERKITHMTDVGSTRDIGAKGLVCWYGTEWVRTPVALLRSLLD